MSVQGFVHDGGLLSAVGVDSIVDLSENSIGSFIERNEDVDARLGLKSLLKGKGDLGCRWGSQSITHQSNQAKCQGNCELGHGELE
jgi:hypothetical protein